MPDTTNRPTPAMWESWGDGGLRYRSDWEHRPPETATTPDDGDYGRTAYAGNPRDQEDWNARRNVAAIMGWKRADGYDDRWEHPVTHVAHLAGDGYTCDDMIRWIDDRSPWGFVGIRPNDGDFTVLLYLKANDTEFDEHSDSTIHEALEQAVRAIGGTDA